MALSKLSLLALAFLRGSQRQTWSVTVFNQTIKTEIRIIFESGDSQNTEGWFKEK